MLRRYLVALVGAPVGFAAVVAVYHFGLDFVPDYRLAAGAGIAAAGSLMAKGESLGLVPPAENLDHPASLFTDEKGRRR